MELLRIYECFCDLTRLRLLHVLTAGPLCVCHFQTVLGEPQVKISKHLAYLRTRGLVTTERRGNWIVYALSEKPSAELRAQLACLRDAAREQVIFQRDREALLRLAPELPEPGGACGCARSAPRSKRRVIKTVSTTP